jgi:hypothetical protein
MNFPFRRKQDVSDVPAEIQDYYKTERRERTGIAWLLALGTLIVTIGLATLLFFGGRWAYRAITNNDNDNQETAQVDQESENQDNPESREGAPGEEATPPTGTSSTNTSTPNSPNPAPSTSTPGTSSTPAAPGTSTPVAGSSTNLPNSGPGDVFGLFVIVTVVATAAHYTVSTRRTE